MAEARPFPDGCRHDSYLSSLGKLAPPILTGLYISPFGSCYRYWDLLFVVLAFFYTSWIPLLEFGFLESTMAFLVVEDVVDVFFIVDIVITFFVAYVDTDTYVLVNNHGRIAWRYLRTIIFDVISSIPSHLVGMIHLPAACHRCFKLFKLWRIWRVHNFCARLENDTNYYFLVRWAKMIYVTFFILHLEACFFGFMDDYFSDSKHKYFSLLKEKIPQQNLFERYATSMYWAITTLSTVGYGDIYPVSTVQRVFTIFVMILNIGVCCYVLGNTTDLVHNQNNRTMKYRDEIQAVKKFSLRNLLTDDLRNQMINHMRLQYRIDSDGLQQKIISSLCTCLRSSISSRLFYNLINEVNLFDGVSEDAIHELASKITVEYFDSAVEVILRNQAPTCFYILVTGDLEVCTIQHHAKIQVVPGRVVGEIGVLTNRPQKWTVRTTSLSQVIRVDRSLLVDILQSRVRRGDGHTMMRNLLEDLERSQIPEVGENLGRIRQMLDANQIKSPFDLSAL